MSERWRLATSTPMRPRPNLKRKKEKKKGGNPQRLDLLHHFALAQLGAISLFEEPETQERGVQGNETGASREMSIAPAADASMC